MGGKCKTCGNPLTWAAQRRQYGRLVKRGLTPQADVHIATSDEGRVKFGVNAEYDEKKALAISQDIWGNEKRGPKPYTGDNEWAMSTCAICGRGLTDSTSIQRKLGPVCWKKVHPEANGRRAHVRSHRRADCAEQLELPLASVPVPIEADPHPNPKLPQRSL